MGTPTKHSLTDLEAGATRTDLRYDPSYGRARGIGKADREKTSKEALAQLPICRQDTGGMDLNEHLAGLRFWRGNLLLSKLSQPSIPMNPYSPHQVY